MQEFPDITIADPNLWLWLWLLIPLGLAAGAFIAEIPIEKLTEKWFGRPVVGIGYITMGVFLLVAAVCVPLIPDAIESERNADATIALEEIGFEDVRITMSIGTFGAYWEGELMRGVLVEEPAHPGTFQVLRTNPRP